MTKTRPYGRKARALDTTQPPPIRRTGDFPTDVADGRSYVIKGIPPSLLTAINRRREVERRSLGWVVLRLLTRYAKGEVDP